MIGQDASASALARRRVFVIVSPSSLGYFHICLESLLGSCDEPLHLHLITDSDADRERLIEEITVRQNPDASRAGHLWNVFAEDELADREATIFGSLPNLRAFRHGHPCWRKVTDPLLLSEDGEEMVLLDPDVFFPNRFRFETTPVGEVLLMWQRPNCLYPPEVVRAVLKEGIALAHHVDIGVGGWRAPVDLEWLDWLLGRIGVAGAPRVAHIEAIVWAAIAMRIGGGYLNPGFWHCWHRGQIWRALRILGVPGVRILRGESFASMKCFHAGGEAKDWLVALKESGLLDHRGDRTQAGTILPFEQLHPASYYRELWIKDWLGRLGYYSLVRMRESSGQRS